MSEVVRTVRDVIAYLHVPFVPFGTRGPVSFSCFTKMKRFGVKVKIETGNSDFLSVSVGFYATFT